MRKTVSKWSEVAENDATNIPSTLHQKALNQFPNALLIKNALLWREAWRDEAVDHAATFPETLQFVQFVIDQIVAKSD